MEGGGGRRRQAHQDRGEGDSVREFVEQQLPETSCTEAARSSGHVGLDKDGGKERFQRIVGVETTAFCCSSAENEND